MKKYITSISLISLIALTIVSGGCISGGNTPNYGNDGIIPDLFD